MTKELWSAANYNKRYMSKSTHVLETYQLQKKNKANILNREQYNFWQQGNLSEVCNMYPNLCKNYVDVVTGEICAYGSDSRHHIWLHSCDKRRHEDNCHYFTS